MNSKLGLAIKIDLLRIGLGKRQYLLHCEMLGGLNNLSLMDTDVIQPQTVGIQVPNGRNENNSSRQNKGWKRIKESNNWRK